MAISISIVTYEPNYDELNTLCKILLDTITLEKVFIVDNSAKFDLGQFKFGNHESVCLILNKKNIGFGSAHNLALRKSIDTQTKYHLVLNSDILFERGMLDKIIDFMDQNTDVGSLMPKVYYPNGEVQKLCKLLPSPSDLFLRRFFPRTSWAKKRNNLYELADLDYGLIANIPNLSGCFMFIRTDVLKETGLFDERYFLYLEDVDLNRRIHRVSRTVFYPMAEIVHGYKKGSYNNIKLLSYHVISSIKYFNKWGWLRDEERMIFNDRALSNLF